MRKLERKINKRLVDMVISGGIWHTRKKTKRKFL